MAKREFLQLCHQYKPGKKNLSGWLMSRKLDGVRVFWDAGISRGLLCKDVSFANVEKDKRFVEEPRATGLWSRLGKPFYAPDWFLDQLPPILLDGEFYIGPGKFQETISIVKTMAPGRDWSEIKFKVFDAVPMKGVFADGVIETRIGNQLYKRELKGVLDWIKTRPNVKTIMDERPFIRVHEYLKGMGLDLVEQEKLSHDCWKDQIEERLKQVLDEGDEGLVFRDPYGFWTPARVHHCLKFKPFTDDEAVVLDYLPGENRLEGMMGACMVRWNGKSFRIGGGFTDAQRRQPPAIGSTITFRYRELSNEGIPREARFIRLRED